MSMSFKEKNIICNTVHIYTSVQCLSFSVCVKLQLNFHFVQGSLLALFSKLGAGSKLGRRDGAVVKALTSHQCGPGLIPGINTLRGLSLLLVLVPAPRVFLRVLRFFSLHKNQHFQIPIRPANSGRIATLYVPLTIPIYTVFSNYFIPIYFI